VITIQNCVDEQRLGRVDRDAARRWLGLRDEYLFVSVARPSVQKNQIGLIRAFTEVAAKHPDVHLLTVGGVTQPMYARMAEIVATSSPVARRIHLREHLDPPTALLAAADGFVLNPFFEGGPIATTEALLFGVPVVVSETGAAPDQIGDGWAGHLVPNPTGDPHAADVSDVGPFILGAQRNHRELVTAMLDLVEHRERWADRREQIAATAAERFGAEASLRRHAELLSAVAQAKMPSLTGA
jgi:glycosyltransferase involved in cell wall biosynthesis